MQTLSLPDALARPVLVSGRVASKVMLDLTIYLKGPSEQEFDRLINLYERTCPLNRLVKYKIAELEFWPSIGSPVLTASGRAAAGIGSKYPYFEPARERIRQGRAFEAQFWDGRKIDDPDGSWSFNCRSIHLRSNGLFAFARVLVPLKTDPEILRNAALTIADSVELYSGHAGLVFVYNTWLLQDAFDAIYSQARRFWGVDVEYMNRSLTLMRNEIKGVNWLTLLGPRFSTLPEVQGALSNLAKNPVVTVEQRNHAVVLIAGPQPVVGDQHRPDHSLDPYYAVAQVLEPFFLKAHPDFPSEQWVKNANTVGWIRRFVEPEGWR